MAERAEQKVVIIGQGYVGLPVAMRAVEVGFDVVGIDADPRKITALNAGESYVEDIPSTQLQAAIESGRFVASLDAAACSGFSVAVIAVPTPLHEGMPDLTFMEKAGAFIAPEITPGATVILESTTYPGTTEELLVPILEAGSGLKAGVDFYVGYSPERIDPGNPTWTFVNTPKVVSGIDEVSLAHVDEFYSALVERTVTVSTPKEAELTKLLENTFRHVNVALVNELAVFASQLGIDVWEAIDAASTKPFGFMRFTPGPGVGGHCLPIDPTYLSWQVRRVLQRPFRFVELANDVNEQMPAYVVQRIGDILNRDAKAFNGSTVVLLGLALQKEHWRCTRVSRNARSRTARRDRCECHCRGRPRCGASDS
jgi:UDP-N-acetyl-D-glucosamine dehydrogenase